MRTLLAARSGDLWIGTDEGETLFRFTPGTKQLRRFDLPPGFRFIRTLTEDAAGAVWAGATDGLLVRIAGDILTDESAVTGRLSSIRCLHAASNGDLWIGFSGTGAGRWRAGQFHRFGLAEGIPNAYISQILTDDRGVVWFAGNQGIFEVREQDFDEVAAGQAAKVTPVVYGRNEGMTGLQASFDFSPASVRASGNRLFFSMLTGVAEVRLDRARINRIPPPVFIESVTADGITAPVYPKLLPAPPGGEVPPSAAGARRRFAAASRPAVGLVRVCRPSFTAPERVRFRVPPRPGRGLGRGRHPPRGGICPPPAGPLPLPCDRLQQRRHLERNRRFPPDRTGGASLGNALV